MRYASGAGCSLSSLEVSLASLSLDANVSPGNFSTSKSEPSKRKSAPEPSWQSSGMSERLPPLNVTTSKPSPSWMRPAAHVRMLCAVTLLLSLGLCQSSAAAQAVPIEEGEPAPFSGQLLRPAEAAALVVKVEQAAERTAIEIARATRIHEADLQLVEARHGARADAAEKRAFIYQTALEVRDAWYRHEAFWFALGTVAALIVTGVVGATFSALARSGVYLEPSTVGAP